MPGSATEPSKRRKTYFRPQGKEEQGKEWEGEEETEEDHIFKQQGRGGEQGFKALKTAGSARTTNYLKSKQMFS